MHGCSLQALHERGFFNTLKIDNVPESESLRRSTIGCIHFLQHFSLISVQHLDGAAPRQTTDGRGECSKAASLFV